MSAPEKYTGLEHALARSFAQSESTDSNSLTHSKQIAPETGDLGPHDELETQDTLRKIKENHRWDPNLPASIEEDIQEATFTADASRKLSIVESIVGDSPYPEVRAAVRNVCLSLVLVQILANWWSE